MRRRIYLDSSVLIAIVEGEPEIARCALDVLDDPNDPVDIISSEAVRLEVLPTRLGDPKKTEQTSKIDALFCRAAAVVATFHAPVWQRAIEEAKTYQMQAPDALHVAAALSAEADELLTAEGPR